MLDPGITELVLAVLAALGVGGGGVAGYRRYRNGHARTDERDSPRELLLERLANASEKQAETGSHMLAFMERVDGKLERQADEHERIIGQNYDLMELHQRADSQFATGEIRARLPVIETKIDSISSRIDNLKP